MNVLIDTHILLWALADTKKLGRKEKEIILSEDTTVYVSAISLWEISLKYSIGKLKIASLPLQSIIQAIEQSGYNIITLTAAEAIGFYQLPKTAHTDPFDRMLVWQAICNQYYFMTRDNKLKFYTKFGLQLI